MPNSAHNQNLVLNSYDTIISFLGPIAGPTPSRLSNGSLGMDAYIYCNYEAVEKEVAENHSVMEEDYDYYEGCVFGYLERIFGGKTQDFIFNAMFNAISVPVFKGFDLDILSKDLYIYFNYDAALSEHSAKNDTALDEKSYYKQHINVFLKYIFTGKTPYEITRFLSLLDHFN